MNWGLLHKSISNEWGTPSDLFDFLNLRFRFDLDAAASSENAKTPAFFSVKDCAFKTPWHTRGSRVWLNPPYGRRVKLWVERARAEAVAGKIRVCVLVMARTDTAFFHDELMKAQELYFIRGRLRFTRNDGHTGPAPCGSLVALFDGRWHTKSPQIKTMEKNKEGNWEILNF